jgi:glycosyltransferase involved in cell wall biosynthesis
VKIGILSQDFIGWSGGVDFLAGVVESLLASPRSKSAEFYLIIADSGPRLLWRQFKRRWKDKISGKTPKHGFAPSAEVVREAFAPFENQISIQHIDVGRSAFRRAVDKLKLDAVLPALNPPARHFTRPWVGYAFDFQHKYFSQNFTPESCRSRDEHFAAMLTTAKAVIVNSRAVASDIAKFVPQATARVFALPFSAAPHPDWFEDISGVPARYGIDGPYFIISNQFWPHKDHATAFEAFALLAAQKPEVQLVCTGSTLGASDPEYFPNLMRKMEARGLKKRVHILGLIPKRDQIELMKNSCAVVQPTLFEGGPGGGCIYDAVALDLPAIISDIPVNREIENQRVGFFPAGNAEALAIEMNSHLGRNRGRPDASALLSAGRARRAACGDMLWQAIDFVLDK